MNQAVRNTLVLYRSAVEEKFRLQIAIETGASTYKLEKDLADYIAAFKEALQLLSKQDVNDFRHTLPLIKEQIRMDCGFPSSAMAPFYCSVYQPS